MTVCHHCGQDKPLRRQWNGLAVSEMGEAFWHGLKFKVTRQQTDILKSLISRGEATHLALEMSSASLSGGCVKVQICKLRETFRRAGVPVTIRSIHGIGYRLEMTQ